MSRCAPLVILAVLAFLPYRAVSADEADPTVEEVRRLRGAAAKAHAEGKREWAERHLAQALALAPDAPGVHEDLLRFSEDRPEEFLLWSQFVAARACDHTGVWTRPKDFPSALVRRMEPALEITRLRAAAVERLAGMAKRLDGVDELALAKYLRSLFRLLTEGSPALSRRHLPAFEEAVERCLPDPVDVLEQLTRRMKAAHHAGDGAAAIRAAVIVRGVVVQARHGEIEFRGRDALEAAALDVMDSVRRIQSAKRAPLSVEDLRAIPPRFRPTWEARHRDWSNPTAAVSPNDRYRIESTCGVRTALITAADVEYQHARLVRWFGGRDPFLKIPGIVRLCRSPTDLEGQGKPFWWAPGFQSGDLTCLTINFDDRYGLAGVLTHELTHRFDGALYPGIPVWLLEGRACFTAGGTLWPRSPAVEPRVEGIGSLWDAAVKGYGDPKELAKIIEGTVKDYRHYYPVGYSLWIYLTRLRKDWYAARVEPYMKSCASNRKCKPMERFARFFLDGKKGRPADFEAFAKDFSRFLWEAVSLDGFPWKTAWIEESEAAHRDAHRQVEAAARAAGDFELATPHDRAILDHSNSPRIRCRSAPPALGEGQAWAAALWFEANGHPAAAAEAFAWAREVDEATDEQLVRMAALHARERHPGRAWLLRLAASHRSVTPVDPASAPAEIRKVHRILIPLRDTLASTEASTRDAGQPRLARAAAADLHALSRRAGMPFDSTAPAEPAGRDLPPPDCGPWLGVLADGVVEERWAPADTRVSGNWNVDAPDLLILGSSEPFRAISSNLRDAGVRRVHVRGREWFEGTYTVRVRVRLVSAHVGAAIVVGHSRHDRGFVIRLDGGDFAYAIGRKDEDAGFRSIHVGINDLRSWDGGVGRLGKDVPFDSPRTTFLVTIRVSGSFVQVRVDGRHILSHRTTTGVPVAGRIGFRVGHGLLAFEAPAVRRHRTIGPAATCPCEHGDEPLDFSRPVEVPFEMWTGRRVVGPAPDPLGTIFLCYPGSSKAAPDEEVAERAFAEWAGMLGPEPARKRIRVLYPHRGLPSLERAMKRWLEEETTRRLAHDGNRTREQVRSEIRAEWRSRPPWFSVDPRGVLRARGIKSGPWSELARVLTRRLRGF